MTKLLVAAGDETLKKVEIINLDESNSNLVCDDLPNLPDGYSGPTGHFLMGSPVICSGNINKCNCHSYQNGSWNIISKPNECRKDASSTVISLSDNKEVLFVSGGFHDLYLSSVETFNGNVWDSQHVTNLPEARANHCIVKINSTMLLSVGGYLSNHVYFYDALKNNWIPGPSMKEQRAGLSCALLTQKNLLTRQLEKFVVVAGGYNEISHLSSTELLFLNKDGSFGEEWNNGPELPEKTSGSRMIEYLDSVILVGGLNLGEKLHQLFSPFGPWIPMRQTLKTHRNYHVAFLVADDIVDCHN